MRHGTINKQTNMLQRLTVQTAKFHKSDGGKICSCQSQGKIN